MSAPALDDVLVSQPPVQPSEGESTAEADPITPIAEAYENARVDVEFAKERPEDASAQLEAAHSLAVAADLRLLNGQLDRLPGEQLSVDDWVDLEDSLPSEVKKDVLGLTTAGRDYADRAAALTPSSLEAAYLGAFHLSLVAWAEGARSAALKGHGSGLAKRMREVAKLSDEGTPLEGDPSGPWRLRGRFLDKAPWPYGDNKEAIQLLQIAVEKVPKPINYLFLGDAQWSDGQEAEARTTWGLGLESGDEDDARKDLLRARLGQL